MPSTTATGASVSGSKTTQTPWIRGSPPTVTSLTAAAPPAAEGITNNSPAPTAIALRGGSVSGSKPARNAASRASAAAA
ncbi:hypothetical protein DSM104299_01396 [Baekduia alba]|nr:hypothetical protein DSM104299_01396 [Baekduia alba]